jgi:hypothetical protein
VPPELGVEPGGATPPLFGSTPPPFDGVPVLGVEGCEAGGVLVPPLEGVLVDGVPLLGVPPPEPPIAAPPDPFWPFLFFFLSPGCTGSPLVTGGITGTVSVELELGVVPPPPLEAIAITTIRKKAAPASATSLRRR